MIADRAVLSATAGTATGIVAVANRAGTGTAVSSARHERDKCGAVRAAARSGGNRSDCGNAGSIARQPRPQTVFNTSCRCGQGTGVEQGEHDDDDRPRERGDANIVRPARAAMRARLWQIAE